MKVRASWGLKYLLLLLPRQSVFFFTKKEDNIGKKKNLLDDLPGVKRRKLRETMAKKPT